ncbi:hypothetical protein BX666DRAFT_1926316 [Dichotomocladium elegans]|nr:hypothetical protein BX666DRAFT_1926316 [Dichotomocladium elegans]
MIDLAAAFIASLVRQVPVEVLRANVNFIRKTLSRAQVSCSSLLLSLWYVDQVFQNNKNRNLAWSARDLFIASIVVADKFLADAAWTNADWVANTNNAYQLMEINRLEREFLHDLHYRLYVPAQSYFHFCSFLEFQLIATASRVGLSYGDIRILSENLPKVYVDRLHLSLRPFEAMWLMARTVATICVVYVTTVLAGYALRTYILAAVRYTLAHYAHKEIHEQAMVMAANAIGQLAIDHVRQSAAPSSPSHALTF